MSPGSSSRISARGGARPGAAGFTLIEILVVLVVTALITGTLFFALERVLDVRVRIAEYLDGTDTPNLVADWFRQSVDGLVADVKGGPDQFSGEPRRLTGLTLAPLNGKAGVPTRMTWEIAYDAGTGRTYLRYQAANAPLLTIASWPDDRGDFRYCGENLSCAESWPPATGKASAVPPLIRLDTVRGTEAWAILAAPRNNRVATAPAASMTPP